MTKQTVTEKKLAALYCRVSSKGQASGDKVSLPEQEIICRDLCVKQNLEVAGVYVEARSATSDDIADRPELMRLLADAEAGKFAYMVAYHQDRVSRNMDLSESRVRKSSKFRPPPRLFDQTRTSPFLCQKGAQLTARSNVSCVSFLPSASIT